MSALRALFSAAGGVRSAVKGKRNVVFPRGANLLFELTAPVLVPKGPPAPEAAEPAG